MRARRNERVILWDGMLDVDGYESLARHFASRGRRVILVGSSYRQSDALAVPSTNLIAAPSELSASELERLSTFLGGFEQRLAGLSKLASFDSTFLVFLYRLLPPARTSVREGVLRELEQTERMIVERASESSVQHEPRTALGWAMLESGLLSELQFDSVSPAGNPGEQFSVVEDFTSLTMVAAQFGLAVPLELILRATGRDGRANLSRLLTDIDLVRWIEDPAGNFLLGARSRLEAQLIARTRFGTLATEIGYVRRLLLQVTDLDAALSGRAEVAFAIELLRGSEHRARTPNVIFLSFEQLPMPFEISGRNTGSQIRGSCCKRRTSCGSGPRASSEIRPPPRMREGRHCRALPRQRLSCASRRIWHPASRRGGCRIICESNCVRISPQGRRRSMLPKM